MLRDQRLRDIALLLPMLAVVLFLPVMLTLVSGHRWIAGLPSLPTFIFAVWLALIVASAWLARALSRERAGPDPHAPPD